MIRYSRGTSKLDAYPVIKDAADFDAFQRAVLADRARRKGLTYFAAPFKSNDAGKPHRCMDGVDPRRFLGFDVDRIDGPDTFSDFRLRMAAYRGFGYTTASSTPDSPRCRIILELDREVGRAEGMRLCAAIRRDVFEEFGERVNLDKSTDKGEQPLYGPLVESEDFILYGDPVDVDAVLARVPEADPPEPPLYKPDTNADPVVVRLRERGLVRRQRPDKAFDISCPFEAEHTMQGGTTETVYFPPHTGGYKRGHWKCMHNHCQARGDAAFMCAIGLGPDEEPPSGDSVSVPPEALDPAAFHGLAGQIVRAIEPDTEADPAALLLQVLVAFGALVGRGPHYRVEGDQHHANLFAVLVGETAKARKGTSWGRVREIFGEVERWPNVVSGLSSGEGLKWRVRDPITKKQKDKKTEFVEEVETDPGVSDKRLLVIEPEFAQVLRQGARAGNTLSSTVRCAWDTGHLSTLTKNDPVVATNAHVCVVAHITADELRAELTATESANGFANRFLFMSVQRSKKLPFGGGALDAEMLSQFRARITRAAFQARLNGAIRMSRSAREIWQDVYPTLSEGLPGLFGAVTARAEAQAVRLALVYALLDEAEVIDGPHVLAALAIWGRAQESARFIFGATLGDVVADEILRGLRVAGAEGMSRTDISGLFRRHQTADRIGAALELLSRRKLARVEKRSTAGAPVEVWIGT